MRRTILPLTAGLIALALAGCHAPAPQPGRGAVAGPDPVAARVGPETLHVSDVARAARAEGLIGPAQPIDPTSQLFRTTLEAVVDQRLLAHEAIRGRLDHSAAVHEKLDAARDKILGDALLEQVVGRAVNAQAVQALYEEQKRHAKPGEDEVRARQIVLPSEAEANAAKRQLAGGEDFAKLAAQRSTDAATRFAGGDLGWLPVSGLPAGYVAPLTTATTGEVVGPFKAGPGWVVARLEGRRTDPGLTLEAARPQIVRFLTYDEIRTLLSRLRVRDKVAILMGPPAPPVVLPATGAHS